MDTWTVSVHHGVTEPWNNCPFVRAACVRRGETSVRQRSAYNILQSSHFTMAPMFFAVCTAARPATPPPSTSTFAGATLPAAVIWPARMAGAQSGMRWFLRTLTPTPPIAHQSTPHPFTFFNHQNQAQICEGIPPPPPPAKNRPNSFAASTTARYPAMLACHQSMVGLVKQ